MVEKTKFSIRGNTNDVLEALAKRSVEVATITRELLIVMSVADMDKIEVTEEHYKKDLPEKIEIRMEGDKLMLEIIRD